MITTKRPLAAAAIVALALIANTTGARAQISAARPDPVLARIDSLADSGRLADARQALAHWNAAHPLSDQAVPSAVRAHSLLLRARLATTWTAAEEALIGVALGYPISAHAADALMRLAQGLFALADAAPASNSATRAASYLERLVNDYPTSPQRGRAFFWLARAYSTTGRSALACSRLAESKLIQLDSLTLRLVIAESDHICPAPRSN